MMEPKRAMEVLGSMVTKTIMCKSIVAMLLALMVGMAHGMQLQAMQGQSNREMLTKNSVSKNYPSNEFQAAALKKVLSVDLQNVTLEQGLKTVARKAGVKLVYSKNIIPASKQVSLRSSATTLENALWTLLAGTGLRFGVSSNNHLVIMKRAKEDKKTVQQVQAETITGTVTDGQSGETLPGVNILVKGTSTGTSTDTQGAYELTVESLQDTLVFSFIGYQQQSTPINGRTQINIEMQSQAIAGEEMVVVGYGTQRKSDLTGSVGSISSEDLEKQPTTNISESLSGKVAGVDVSLSSGRPGSSPTVRVRGTTSISNTNEPLYVVDDVMMDLNSIQGGISPINTINPDNIKSIEVLKDASATSIYGARGANGVILITTKKGGNITQASFDGYMGIGTVSNRLNLMNADEFLKVEDIAYKNAEKFDPGGFRSGKYINPTEKRQQFMIGNDEGNPELFDRNLNPIYSTDWQNEAFRPALTYNSNLSFSGGNESTTYGTYLNYRKKDGVMKNTWLNRYSGRVVIDSKINGWLSTGASINYNMQSQRRLSHWGYRAVYQAIPIIPVKLPNGSFTRNEVYPGVEGPNQRKVAEGEKYILNTQNTIGNAFTNIKFSEKLNLKTRVSANIIRQETDRYAGRNLDWVSKNQGGIAQISHLRHENWQFENLLRYNNDFNNHSIKALLGQTIQTISSLSSNAESWDFIDDYFEYNNLGIGSNPRPPSSKANEYSISSFFGRINYSYLSKYLLTLSGRLDGASKFGKSNRFAFFPSVALSWVASNEKFLADNSAISMLKLRTSFGLTGNSEAPNYQYEPGLGTYTAIFNDSRETGIGISRLANPNLKWETNAQYDLGIELGLFNSRLSIEADIYRRTSKNMLLNRPVPISSGYSTVTENIGSMRNQGLELSLITRNISTQDFSWTTNIKYSTNKNEVLELYGGSDIYMGDVPGGTPGSIIREGLPVNTFIGYVRLGTWNTSEKKEAAVYNRQPGDIKYKDINNDGAINSNDWVTLGNGTPDGYGSLINTFDYKNFELSVDLQFVYGNNVMWEITQVLEDRTGAYNNMVKKVLTDAWTPQNQDTPIAQNKPLGVGYDTKNDSYRLKDGSFIRGKNLSLSYSLPRRWITNWGIKNLRLYLRAKNFFTLTKFPGYDPEVSTSSSQFSRGRASFNDYPKERALIGGAHIDF